MDDGSEDAEAQSRLAQIQAAIRRGEEKAEQAKALGTADVGEEAPAGRRLTPDEESLLENLFVRPEQHLSDLVEKEGSADVSLTSGMAASAASDEAAAEARIRKALEFCPDGKLARTILADIRAEGGMPGVGAYNAVLEAFSRRGALDDALSLFSEMTDRRIDPTDASYDLLAAPAARAGEYRFVEMLYADKARTRDGDIGSESLALMFDAYANSLPPKPGKAESAFRGAMASAEERAGCGTVSMGDIVSALPERVVSALRRAVGVAKCDSLLSEYGLDDAPPSRSSA